jgi:hypothetical protein
MSSGDGDLVAVWATTDETAVAIARSILEDAGIAYEEKGSGLRRFGGSTFLGATLGPLMGQTIILVEGRDSSGARELLQGLSGVIRPPGPD